MALERLQVRRGVVRFDFAGVAEPLDRAVPAVRAACAVPAAAQRVRLSVKDGVRAMRVAVNAMRAAHVCYVVSAGVLREKAQYLRARRAPCASTL